MKKLGVTFLFAGLLFLLASCSGIQPPVQPVSSMIPTVMSAKQLSMFKPCRVSEEQVIKLLDDLYLLPMLKSAGMQDEAMANIVRGLASKRGYAELDARRSDINLQWIAFIGLSEHELRIIAGFKNLPEEKLWQGNGASLQKVTGEDNNPLRYEVSWNIKVND